MKDALYLIAILVLGGIVTGQGVTIVEMKEKDNEIIASVLEINTRTIEFCNGSTNALQDTLEGRIGAMEQDLDDLKYIFKRGLKLK